MEPLIQVIVRVILMLLIASLVAIATRRFRVPYTVGLVLIGLAVSWLVGPREHPLGAEISLPDIILVLLVPPLIFEAAFHIRIEDLSRDIWLILLLAIPGVILTTLMVGGLVSWGTGLAIQVALVFGALIAATDPVAVVALFRSLGAPKRLQVLLEGESLFNDGTAIVMFGLMLSIVRAGDFDLTRSVADFLRIAGGGALVGVILGMVVSQIIGRIDEPMVETTLTTVLAYGAYLIGEEAFHVSGVLAVVAAGIVNGNIGPRGMSPTTRVVVHNFWEYAAFLANSLVFLLIGLTIDLNVLYANIPEILWAIVAVLLARAVSIYGFSLFGRDLPGKWRHVLYWGGLRGAIALALALSLSAEGSPEGLAGEVGRLQAMAFGVVLFTLLIQGFTMDALVRRLELVKRSFYQEEYERRHARFVAARAAYEYLQRMSRQGLISEHTWRRLSPLLEQQSKALIEAVKDVLTSDPSVAAEELDTARREALRAQRSALTGLLRDGVISEETYAQLVGEVDAAMTEEHLSWPGLLHAGGALGAEIHWLMTAVIQEQDLESATSALNKLGFSVARLPSTGGFLSRRNVTLLIGIPKGSEETAVKVLESSCQRRVEFVPLPMRNLPLPLPVPTQVVVGGATVFLFEVEAYDEF